MRWIFVTAAAATLAVGFGTAGLRELRAGEKPKLELTAAQGVADVLNAAMAADQRVLLVLKNGKEYGARVKAVGKHGVVLKGPDGKEFFDIHVVLSEVAAVEVRVRDK